MFYTSDPFQQRREKMTNWNCNIGYIFKKQMFDVIKALRRDKNKRPDAISIRRDKNKRPDAISIHSLYHLI